MTIAIKEYSILSQLKFRLERDTGEAICRQVINLMLSKSKLEHKFIEFLSSKALLFVLDYIDRDNKVLLGFSCNTLQIIGWIEAIKMNTSFASKFV